MIEKPIDKIAHHDIESLVTNQVRERRTLEYKRELPGNKDSDKNEFLADVSSFANAIGGDLLFGVDEKRDGEGQLVFRTRSLVLRDLMPTSKLGGWSRAYALNFT